MTLPTGSLDTSAAAASIQTAIFRAMSPEEKAGRVRDLTRTVGLLAIEGLRRRHPDLAEEELRRLSAVQRLGEELVERVYGLRREP